MNTASRPSISKLIQQKLWAPSWQKTSLPIRILINFLRYLSALIRDISRGQITLHAVSLVYTILLSIVPVLALCFSILKGLGVHRNQDVINLIDQFLQPLGPKGSEVTQKLLGFVENMRGDILGLFGVLFLFFIALSLIRKVENSFNSIWEIQGHKNFAKRLTEYVGALVIAPVLMLSALALGTTISSHQLTQQASQIAPIGFLVQNFGKLVPTLLVIGTFTFLYKFIPNTKVKFKHALIGGAIAGFSWSFIGFLFANFVANSTRYTAIYSSFAILVMFMIWLYISCIILLIGARLVFYLAHSQHLKHGSVQINLTPLEEIGFASEIMLQVSRDFETGAHSWDVDALSRYYQLPSINISQLVGRLEAVEIIRQDENGALFPGRQPAKISLSDIANALFNSSKWSGSHRFDTRLKELLDTSQTELMHSLNKQSLAEILESKAEGIETDK